MTLQVDVAGSMHFWGLTIDTVTTIILILAIGLAVDYSAHIGHMFMTVTGTRAGQSPTPSVVGLQNDRCLYFCLLVFFSVSESLNPLTSSTLGKIPKILGWFT